MAHEKSVWSELHPASAMTEPIVSEIELLESAQFQIPQGVGSRHLYYLYYQQRSEIVHVETALLDSENAGLPKMVFVVAKITAFISTRARYFR